MFRFGPLLEALPRFNGDATSSRVPEGSRVYVIGDIHGRSDLLRQLHERILADAGAAPGKRRSLVYLGDYVDRGPGSFEVLEILIHEPLEGFARVHLKGNHEDMMLRFLTERADANWLFNGGDATLASYGIPVGWMLFGTDTLETLRQRLGEALPPDHLAFLRGLGLYHVEGDYLFVHAGMRPGVAPEDQRPRDLMWIRETFLDSSDDFGKRVVHGHSIVPRPDIRRNRIGIDTGAFYTGRLTCLVLEDGDIRFLST